MIFAFPSIISQYLQFASPSQDPTEVETHHGRVARVLGPTSSPVIYVMFIRGKPPPLPFLNYCTYQKDTRIVRDVNVRRRPVSSVMCLDDKAGIIKIRN